LEPYLRCVRGSADRVAFRGQLESFDEAGREREAVESLHSRAQRLLGGERLVGDRATGKGVNPAPPHVWQRRAHRWIDANHVLVCEAATDVPGDFHGGSSFPAVQSTLPSRLSISSASCLSAAAFT